MSLHATDRTVSELPRVSSQHVCFSLSYGLFCSAVRTFPSVHQMVLPSGIGPLRFPGSLVRSEVNLQVDCQYEG